LIPSQVIFNGKALQQKALKKADNGSKGNTLPPHDFIQFFYFYALSNVPMMRGQLRKEKNSIKR
jgi:hypothetical protein